jgi:hypothetical protein
VRHFNDQRELMESPHTEFWDDLEYMPSMDKAYVNQLLFERGIQAHEDLKKVEALNEGGSKVRQ